MEAMAAAWARAHCLVELGAGNCEKAARLFGALPRAALRGGRHLADFLRDSPWTGCSASTRPWTCSASASIFRDALAICPPRSARAAPAVLSRLQHRQLHPGPGAGLPAPHACRLRRRRLLIGVDLVKPRRCWNPPTTTPLGVTAAFNRNLLLHLNRLIGTDFALADWRHVAFFNSPSIHASRCISKRLRDPPRCAGPAASAALPPASASTPRTPTSGAWTISPTC
jgi:L-histidine N-alpha-methyltransferase